MYVLSPNPGSDEMREPSMRCGYLRWQPAQGCVAHAHQDAAEVFVIIEGAARFAVATDHRRVGAGSAVYVPPGVPHALTVAGTAPLLAFWAVMPNHVPSHTFYHEDGSPYQWDPPSAITTAFDTAPFWLVTRGTEWEPAIPPYVTGAEGARAHLHVLTPQTEDGVWNDRLRGGYATWPVGMECDVHAHWEAGEFFTFLEGACAFSSDEGTRLLPAGHTVYVGPDERHKLKSVGDVPLVMFLAVSPNHSPTHTFYAPDGTPVDRDRTRPANPVS